MLVPFACVFTFLVLRGACVWEGNWKRQLLRSIGSALMLLGVATFFAPVLTSQGQLDWLLKDREWPVLYSSNVLLFPDGTRVVPHEPSGRVQIYNAELEFIRGWTIETSGAWVVVPGMGETFFVYTARQRMKYEFDREGNTISAGTYSHEDEPFSKLPVAEGWIEFERPLYLIPLSHPFSFLYFAILSIALNSWNEHLRKKAGIVEVESGWKKRLRSRPGPWEQRG